MPCFLKGFDMRSCFQMWTATLLLALLSAGAVAAPVDNPLARSFYWFRFVGGDDVKKACIAGAPDTYRLVYNATWREQVRAYDIETQPSGSGHMTVRILGQAVLNSVEITEPSSLLDPWRGQRAGVELSREQVTALRAAIDASGGFAFPTRRFEIPSNDYYWAVSACRNGQFTSTAYLYPLDGFKAVKFDRVLFSLDPTGVPVNAVRDLPPSSFRGDQTQVWRLRVGTAGIEY
jgi:hypothetical protein